MGAYPTIARWGIVNREGTWDKGRGTGARPEAFMAEEKLGLHVDTDWKKQAQEEKRKLAEQEEKRKTAATAPAGVVPGAAGAVGAASAAAPTAGPAAARQAGGRGGPGGQREIPPASFATLVQSLLTQVLFYLG